MRYLISTDGKNYFPACGVTTPIDELNKPALIDWGARMTAGYINANARVYVDIDAPAGSDTEMIVSAKVIADAPKKFREIRDQARDDGSIVHDIIHTHISRAIDNTADAEAKYSESVMNAFIAFLTLEKDHAIKWHECESMVYFEDDAILYGGRFDAIAEIKGRKYLIDLKTSGDFYPEMYLQVAAYRKARHFVNGKKVFYRFSENDDDQYIDSSEQYRDMNIDGIGIIRLDKISGIPEMHLIAPDCETKYDARAGKYVEKKCNGANIIQRYIDSFDALCRFYYLYKDRRGLYTTKSGTAGNRIMDGIRAKYSKGE